MKSRNLFLGIFILFIGVVALLSTLDVIDFSWRIACRLWPMIFIFMGIVILPVKDLVKALLLLVALFIGVLMYHYEVSKDDSHWFFSQAKNTPTEISLRQVYLS